MRRTTVRLPEELLEELRKESEKNKRSLNMELIIAVTRYLDSEKNKTEGDE
jgi:metal-responsive CopG/Arc/MetJ family transcriptional regulator